MISHKCLPLFLILLLFNIVQAGNNLDKIPTGRPNQQDNFLEFCLDYYHEAPQLVPLCRQIVILFHACNYPVVLNELPVPQEGEFSCAGGTVVASPLCNWVGWVAHEEFTRHHDGDGWNNVDMTKNVGLVLSKEKNTDHEQESGTQETQKIDLKSFLCEGCNTFALGKYNVFEKKPKHKNFCHKQADVLRMNIKNGCFMKESPNNNACKVYANGYKPAFPSDFSSIISA
eukprot:Nk52_evm16s1524 gene=Nk52_evmTU16s1524